MNNAAQRWSEQARYDLETAYAMLEAERYLYVLFCCQQALEKAMKSVIVKRTGTFPPRIHNLLRLIEAAGIEIEPKYTEFLGELSAYYIQTRYPEEIESMGESINRHIAEKVLLETREVMEWLFSMLK